MFKTPKEIAEKYGFCESYIRKLIGSGDIKAMKIGRIYAIDPANVKKLARQRKPKRKPKRIKKG